MSTNKAVIPAEKQKDYLRRLNTSYSKKGEEKKFYNQFNSGSGQEIKTGKFWRTISSSRLCFDLYSWMADDDNYIDIEFEKKLTGLNGGGSPPNMDVYFETLNDIFFIESKYTEIKGKFSIPEAYWVENDTYHKTDGGLTVKPIIKRYRGYDDVRHAFVSFIGFVKKLEAEKVGSTWFDSKQEICHLLGIVYYLLENKPTKRVHFLNVAANYSFSPLSERFRSEGEAMINGILRQNSIATFFDYQLCSVKDFFGSMRLLNHKGFQSQMTIRELISDTTLYEIPIQ